MELKEIAPYLAHGLKIVNTEFETGYDRIFTIGGVSEYWLDINFNEIDENDNGDNLKPIFHPLSDLTKSCLEGDKIPIVVLAKFLYPEVDWKLSNGKKGAFDSAYGRLLEYNTNIYVNDYAIFNQLKAFNWLYEHHFWLGDQDRFGKDIIDINSLK